MRQSKSNKLGFTLVETLIAVSISVLILTAVLSTTLMVMKISEVALSEAEATRLNIKIRSQFERDLRGISEVLSRSNTSFHFITKDAFGNEKEIYYKLNTLTGPELVRNEVSGSNVEEVLLDDGDDGLESVVFEFYNQMGQVTATAVEANAIKIVIERSIEKFGRSVNRDLEVMMIMFRNKIYDV